MYDKASSVITAFLCAFVLLLFASVIIKPVYEKKVIPVALISSAAACLLLIAANEFTLSPVTALCENEYECEGVVQTTEMVSEGYYRAKVKIKRVNGERTSFYCIINSDKEIEAIPSDIIKGKITFKSLESSSLYSSYKSEGVFVRGVPGETEITKDSKFSFLKLTYRINSFIKKGIYSSLSGDSAALLESLILGNRENLSSEKYNNLKAAGVTHIICVSGLHLSLWCALMMFIFNKTGLPKRLQSLLTIPFILLFMLMAALTPSVVRSGIMVIIMLLGKALWKRSDSLNSLGIALTVMAVINPYSMGAVGLELSALSTLGLILYSTYTENKRSRFSFILTTVFAVLFTAPVTMTAFGTLNLTALISNVLVVFAAEICMVSGFAGAMLSFILPLKFNIGASLSALMAKYIFFITEKLSSFSFLSFEVGERDTYLILFFFFLFLALCFFVFASSKNYKKAAPLAVTLSALLLFGSTALVSFIDEGKTYVRAIDCGNSIALSLKNKEDLVLIGTGDGASSSLSAITAALSNAGNVKTALLLPDSTTAYCGGLSGVTGSIAFDKILYGEPVYAPGVAANENAYLSGEKGEIYSFSYEIIKDKNGITAFYIKNEDVSALIIGDSRFDTGALSEEALSCEIALMRNDYPSYLALSEVKTLTFSCKGDRWRLLSGEMAKYSINTTATAGEGTIVYEIRDGRIKSLPRE